VPNQTTFRVADLAGLETGSVMEVKQGTTKETATVASLVELLGRLEAGAGVRETARARLYAAVDECVAAMVEAASREAART
jgi:hypothetical protein